MVEVELGRGVGLAEGLGLHVLRFEADGLAPGDGGVEDAGGDLGEELGDLGLGGRASKS